MNAWQAPTGPDINPSVSGSKMKPGDYPGRSRSPVQEGCTWGTASCIV